MATGFVGRAAELAALHKRLDRVRSSGEGVAVALRGRRQVGKSRLAQECCDRAGLPYFYFTATKGAAPADAISTFCTELKESSLPSDPDLVPTLGTGSWPDAFRLLASVVPDGPAIVVLDELPWLVEQDEIVEGALQVAWDRLKRTKPVLLLLLGSDLHMMELLTSYDHPMYGRADNMVLGPLNVAETSQTLGLSGSDAIDAHLISGGLPGILASWPHAMPALEFIKQECSDPSAPLFSVPESTLLAEFPAPDQARRVLEAVGGENRTQANIAAAAGGRPGPLASGALSPLLRGLVEDKRVLAIDHPLSVVPGKPALYRVADSNLRLHLSVLRAAQEQARRGRPGTAYQLVERRWPAWRGRAVEPLIRESLELTAAAGELPWPETRAVGGWWNRQFSPELDLVGADRGPVAQQVYFAGSVKWLGTPFDDHDFVKLSQDSAAVPGFTPGQSGMVVVSRSGTAFGRRRPPVDLVWGPEDVVAAWRAED